VSIFAKMMLGNPKPMTEKYRQSDEYKMLRKVVLDVAPNMPEVLIERAIFLHQAEPNLSMKWPELERKWNEKRAALAKKKNVKAVEALEIVADTDMLDESARTEDRNDN